MILRQLVVDLVAVQRYGAASQIKPHFLGT